MSAEQEYVLAWVVVLAVAYIGLDAVLLALRVRRMERWRRRDGRAPVSLRTRIALARRGEYIRWDGKQADLQHLANEGEWCLMFDAADGRLHPLPKERR